MTSISTEPIERPLEERIIDRTNSNRFLPVYVASTDRHFDKTELRILDEFEDYVYKLMGRIPRLTGGEMWRHPQGSVVLYNEACDAVGQRSDLPVAMAVVSHDGSEDKAKNVALVKDIRGKKDEIKALYVPPKVWEMTQEARLAKKERIESEIGKLQSELNEGRNTDLDKLEAKVKKIFMRYTDRVMETLGVLYARSVREITDVLTRRSEDEAYSQSVFWTRESLNDFSYERIFNIVKAKTADTAFNNGDIGILDPSIPEHLRNGNRLRIDGFSEKFKQYYGDRFTLRDLYMHGDQNYMSNAHILLYAFRSVLIINAVNDLLHQFAGASELISWEEASTRKHLAPLIGAKNLEGTRPDLIQNRGGLLGLLCDISTYACSSICDDLKTRGLIEPELELRTDREIEALSETTYFDKLTVQNRYLQDGGRNILVDLVSLDGIPRKDELLLAVDQKPEEIYILTRYLAKVLDKLSTGHRYEGLLGENITAEVTV
jgi:hypothetical protein